MVFLCGISLAFDAASQNEGGQQRHANCAEHMGPDARSRADPEFKEAFGSEVQQ